MALRLPFRSHYLFTWDSANFAFALDAFDVTQHQPHPPGYFFYVMTARLLQALAGDANAAYVAEAILLSGLGVAIVYLLGRAMFGRRCGVVAALLLLFSVTFWTYGEIALPYAALPLFSGLVALLAYLQLTDAARRRRLLPWLGLAYGVGGGFRPELLLLLAPLVAVAAWRSPARDIALGAALALASVAAWLTPTIALSGGLNQYIAAFAAYLAADVVGRYAPSARGLDALLVNIRDTALYTFYALYAEVVPIAGGIVWTVVRRRLDERDAFLALWAAPPLLFYVFVHIGEPGYVFTFLPPLLLAAARFVVGLPAKGGLAGALLFAVLAVNAGVFLFHQRPLTTWGVARHDAAWQARLAFIAERYAPDDTLLVAYDSYKHLRYYLPQYESVWLDIAYGTVNAQPIDDAIRRIVIVDESVARLVVEPDRWRALDAAAGVAAYERDVAGERSIVFDGAVRLLP